ncbi:MAG: N4-gp56 family major capsid protein [Lachnospiraceae bacterium]|nr:N4-gp56 family major capsid protein [Lachnospiraceae bacterium]
MRKNHLLNRVNLQLFADFTQGTTAGTPTVNPVNVTTQASLSPTMKTFYNKTLLENARAEMVFTQFGDKQPMKGNKIEWRKFKTFAKALTPLTEGVIPEGKSFGMISLEAETTQHGDYTAVSDRLELESFDDVIFGATEEMGAAEGETYDTLTRNVLIAGNSVAYCGGKESRAALTNADVLTPEMVAKTATWLKKNRAPLIDGSYVAIIHPSVAFDLRNSEEWKEFHKYNAVAPIFEGEIGKLHNVRFIECNEAKVWGKETAGGANAVYATLFFGKKAYGVLDPEGEGMEMIVKPKGTIGGPLEQFSTIGYKFCHGAKILYQERMIRVESGSSYGDIDEEN